MVVTAFFTPEIGLIPQLADRCRNRFGRRVLEYHSGCSDGERVLLGAASKPMSCFWWLNRPAISALRPSVLSCLMKSTTAPIQESPMPCYHARILL